jgi:hypothetical protein
VSDDADREREKEERRKQAMHDLNPIEDVKGAVEYVKGLDPIEDVKEFMEKAVEVLDPRESDVRAVVPEEDTVSESEERR